MKKIGIVTIQGDNYGNRLQNYALQQKLFQLNFQVETIKDVSETCAIQKIKNTLKRILFSDSYSQYYGCNKDYILKRKNNYQSWNLKHIIYSDIQISKYYIPKRADSSYDFIVAGSDQIWNPYFYKDSRMLLSFVEPKKRISYAASFGITNFPDGFKMKFANELKKFKAISVREQSGVEIVDQLTGKKCTWVLDPTLLLSQNEWKAVEKKPKWLNQNEYILTYSLGGLTEDIKKFINKLCNEMSIEVINILDFNNENWFTIDPFEFIYLIHHSKLMITDSFHGTVFSILFKRPFLIFDRADHPGTMNSRVDSLLKMLKLPSRYFDPNMDEHEIFVFPDHNIDSILEKEKEYSNKFLLDNLAE